MGSIRSMAVALVLVASSCADDASTNGSEEPRSKGSPAEAGLVASCGGSVLDRLPPDTSSLEPFTAFDDLDLSSGGEEAPFFLEFAQGYDWFVTQEGEGWRQLFGEPARTNVDPPYASLRIERRDGAWAPVGWGQCRIVLDAEGYGNASFVIDPKTPPNPGADRVVVMATERACAGGEAPSGRDVRAVILDEDQRSVWVVILVEPGKGFSTCQDNPAFPFEVDLGAPLGDRAILDASGYPPQRRWP